MNLRYFSILFMMKKHFTKAYFKCDFVFFFTSGELVERWEGRREGGRGEEREIRVPVTGVDK